jgi:hypothetical protein
MDFEKEDKLLVLELKTLCDETMKRCESLLKDDTPPRRLFAVAQAAACRDLMKYLQENEEWTDFGEDMEATLENEESRYREARAADDRRMMTITLVNRRILKRLITRLTDPQRRQLLLSELDAQKVGAESAGAGAGSTAT